MSAVARRDSADYSDSQDVEQNSTNDEPESDYDSAGSESEHSEQDAESQETERRVDDDEDRSNPQYIPKRGTFYEHDDRTAASGEELASTQSETSSEKKEGGSPPPERRRPPRKSEVINRWAHDKFNENEQAPKSRDELVAIYGYDIRNEDAPPHARRNRRYGRGPNKYTRTWEDEEAYRRQAAAQPRKPPNPEDFPELEQANKHRRPRGPRPRSRSQPTSTESLANGSALRRRASVKDKDKDKDKPTPPTPQAQAKPNAKPAKDRLPQIENLTITATLNNSQSPAQRRVSAVAQQRPVPTEQGRRRPAPPTQPAPRAPAAPPAAPRPAQPAPPAQQPAGAEPRGSKRYSSLRQRPLAETYSPQQQQSQQQQQPQQQQQQPQQQQAQPQMRYHPAEYAGNAPPPASQHQGSPAPQLHPQQLIHPVHRAGAAHAAPLPAPLAAPPAQHSQQVRLGIVEQQQLLSHSHHALHNLPPQPHNMAAAPLPPAQGYAPPAMLPAQYMQQSGNGAVFGGAPLYAQPPPQPYQHPHPHPHPLYPHHNYATAGGVTYYTAVEQEPAPAPAPRAPRRPTAAIPIVRPDRPANSSEKDNIDRIVENMFVRKPWPGTQPNSDGTKDTETRNSQEPQSKESSQPNSLTSSSISTDSKQENKERTEPESQEEKKPEVKEEVIQDSIADA